MKKIFSQIVAKLKPLFTTERGIKGLVYWGVIFIVGVYLFWGIPLPTRLTSEIIPVSTKIFDRNGKLIYEIYIDKKRRVVADENHPDVQRWNEENLDYSDIEPLDEPLRDKKTRGEA